MVFWELKKDLSYQSVKGLLSKHEMLSSDPKDACEIWDHKVLIILEVEGRDKEFLDLSG